MKDILSSLTEECARVLAANQDALIRECITNRIGDNWTDEEIIPRMRIEQEFGKPEKVYFLDDEPLVAIWPPESSVSTENERSYMNWTVPFLRMP